MSNYRSNHRYYQQQYYGGYCSKCKENKLEPLGFTGFKDLLDEATELFEFKKDIMKHLLHRTSEYQGAN